MILRHFALLLAVAATPVLAQEPASVPAAPRDSTIEVDRVVAIVGSHPILLSDVLTQVAVLRQQNAIQAPRDSAEFQALMENIVDELINAELLVTEANRLQVEVTDAEIRQIVDSRIAEIRRQFGSEAELREALRTSGQGTIEEWRRELTEQARKNELQQRLIAKLKQENRLPPVPITDAVLNEEIQRMGANRPRRPAEVGFRQIIIPTRATEASREAARERIDSIRAEVVRGGDFEQIARRSSMDGTANLGGDLGWIRRGKTVPEFERWAFGLRPGQVSPVFETNFGYHILRVDRAQPGEVKVRHILIIPEVDSTDFVRARAEADSVARAWRAGANYDELVRRHHDAAEQSLVAEYPLEQLPEPYQRGLENVALNQIAEPFEIENPRARFPKLVVAQVVHRNEGGELTPEEIRARFRQQLGESRALRRYLEGLRSSTFVSVRL